MSNTYVKMPATDYQAICDSLRQSTGVLGAITSGSIPSIIEEIANPVTPTPGLPTDDNTSVPDVKEKDINFYDHQGKRLYSYTLEEANNNDWTIPIAPTTEDCPYSHWNITNAFLIAQKPFIQPFDLGLVRRTTQALGAKLWITISTEAQKKIELYCSGGEGTVDWGDELIGSLNSDGSVLQHTYAALGNYIITITPDEGETLSLGDGSNNIFGSTSASATTIGHPEILTRAELNDSIITLNDWVFAYSVNLSELDINGAPVIGQTAFANTFSLKTLALGTTPPNNTILKTNSYYMNTERIFQPYSNAAYATYTLQNMPLLKKLPELQGNYTTINNYTFANTPGDSHDTYIPEGITTLSTGCYQLRPNCPKYYLPSTLESIAAYVFRANTGVKDYYIKAITPPTLANVSAFTGISDDCKIHVAETSLQTYKEATNWSTYADYMVGDYPALTE